METRHFGGVRLPVIGQGTWQMEADDRGSAIRALRRGLDLGMTHIDSAELYGSGKVEELVGEAIRGRRDEIYLVSKVVPSNASRKGTLAACDRSLSRLGTDRLDLYLLHWPGHHPLEGTIAAFEELVEKGKILRWGVSNFDVAELEQAQRIAGPGRIFCNQVLYHLGERAIEHAVIPWCNANGVLVVGYSPFGAGDFPPRGNRAGEQALSEIAAARGATPRQVALRWLIREANVVTIPKASRPAHVEDNAAAGDLSLSDAEIARLDAVYPRGRARGLPTS